MFAKLGASYLQLQIPVNHKYDENYHITQQFGFTSPNEKVPELIPLRTGGCGNEA
jgi:hypothetical protein